MCPEPRTGRRRGAAQALALRASLAAAVLLALVSAPALTPAAARAAAPAPTPRATASPTAAPRPAITVKLVPFGDTRKAQTADYNQLHYRQHTWKLTGPKAIVLHHTAGAEWESAWWTFADNTAYESIPGKPEKPGVSAHFIVDKDGTIYQCLPLTVRGRHAIGINWTSFGIEFVQEVVSGKDGHWMDRQILGRKKQVASGLKLVRYLQDRFGIKDGDVIGHAMVNDSRHFREFTGIKNGAGDWFAAEVKAFRAKL
jgi:beta-N-acetylhexosaminidase